ncbi:MAG: thiamine phosphate synthase [Bacteroidia bacterium]|nr:MAG: thiamine phosphate synthase [Bacteroidia bacterium]
MERLQFITHEKVQETPVRQTELFCRGGGNWVQFRMKSCENYQELKSEALQVQSVCKKYGAIFIINDYVQLCKEIGADGVHLGKNDMPIAEARKILGDQAIIGATANDSETVELLLQEDVDYIGLGPFRFTKTKEGLAPLLGIDGYEKIMNNLQRKNISLPVIAIGGINPEDISAICQTGVHGIAVSLAIAQSIEIEHITKEFLNKLQIQCNL